MDLLQRKKQFYDPISKEYILHENLLIIQNTNNKSFILFDIYTLIDWIISSNSLINPISNIEFTKIQLKELIKNLFIKKFINIDDKNFLLLRLKNKCFKLIFIFTISKNISIKKKFIYINNKLNNFLITNNNIHNKISNELNNNNNKETSLNNMIYDLYNKFNYYI